MEGGMRSGENSSIVVKNRTSSGCLIVRKKSDGSGGVGSSGTRPFFKSKKDNKRPRVVMSDSGSSDELLMPYRSRIRPDTMQVCNGLGVYGKGITGEAEVSRKRMREERFSQSEDGFVRRNGHRLGVSKKNMLDVYDFDEYDRIEEEVLPKGKRFEYKDKHFEDRKLLSSVHRKVSSFERDRDSGPSRHVIIEGRKKNLYPDKNSRLNGDGSSSFRKGRDASHPPLSLSRERYVDSEEPIRVQGKNGVLKLMVNKNKRIGPPLKNFDHLEVEKGRNGLRVENNVRRSMQASPFHMEAEVAEKRDSVMKLEKKQKKLLTSASAMKSKVSDSDSEAGDRSLRVKPNNGESSKLLKKTSRKVEKMQDECTPLTTKIKEGKGKRGCGTEKQKLREKIRGMLLDAGWTIDYRPRRNRDYLDAVYINPSGTAYWSIIKAYDALLKQLNDEETENQNCADGSALAPLPDEVLSQLTRKTRKKMEQEMKKKDVKEAGARKSSIRDEDESMDSLSHEEKLSSFIKQGKLLKSRTNGSENVNLGSKSQGSILHLHNSEKPSPVSNSRIVQGRKIKNVGRCILLVRNSEGLNLEDDGFVPYSGKRTILSWLIDSGAVHLSQKVQYMNRRRSRVMLEGWITGDGIHCGCCSKILTVSKFEIHAGSKLRQPFQNIYLDSGVSLLQCQMDAWNRLEKSERIGFRSIDIDGEDPNDDTCGICGDGGDLICCDGCPSTYHQSCLSIDHLPLGDWHCPKCTCKFCGVGGDFVEEEDENNSLLLTCSLCEKRYHNLCVKEIHSLQVDSSGLVIYFCEQKCKELFEHLQKMLGVKCELEAGFSWSLVRRIDTDVDTFIRGLQQKVECNSKLAVALNVMDECFLPIIDRRSGTNLIHNVLYNCGSNFNRLNYSGFYTAILERGDEIISAASLRFHGTQVAEMPFIGTRHIYRHQGMCRRLFSAIESALSSLKVEKLVIPAIAELTHTWTSAFGFTPLEEKLKEALRFLNMLVFPGIDMLQKLLMMQENAEADMTAGKELRKSELKHCNISKAAKISGRGSKSDSDSSSGHDVSGNAISLEASLEHNASLSADATSGDTESMKKMNDYSPDNNCLFNNDTHHGVLVSNNPVPGSPTDDNTFSCTDDETKDAGVVSHAESKTLLAVNMTEYDVSELRDGVPESFDGKELCSFSVSHKLVGIENKLRLESPTKEFMGSGEGHIGAAQEQDNNVSASDEVKTQCVGDQTSCTISRSGQRLTSSPENCLVSPDASPNALNGESKMVLDAGDESDLQSKGSDASDIDGNGIDDTAGPHDPEMQVLAQESMNAASDTGDMLLDSASERNFRPVDTDLDRMERENTAVLDPYARHFTRSIDNIACHESTSSSRGTLTGISIDESDEYAGISAGYHSDLHDQVNLEDDKKYTTDRD